MESKLRGINQSIDSLSLNDKINIHEKWNSYELKDILIDIIDFRGRTPKKLGMDWGNGDIPAISANNVEMGRINCNKEIYYGSEILYNKWMTNGYTKKGDIVITMEAPLGNIAQIPDDKKYILSQRVILLKTNEHLVTNNFLKYLLMSDYFQQQLRKNATGTTALGIQQKRLVKLIINLPSLQEQLKIAAILNTVDSSIEGTEKIITQTENLKIQLLNILLNKSKSFNTFKLSDISELITKGTTPTTYGFKYQDYGINFIKVESISNEGAFIKTNFAYIDEEANQALKRSILRENDILFSIAGALGRVAIVTKDILPANTNQALAIIRLKNGEKVDINYIKYYLTSKSIQNHIKLISTQSAQPNISLAQINDFTIKLPDISEQRSLVKILDLINEKFSVDNNYLKHLKILKKSLMQVLLTGKIQVKVDTDAQP